MLALYFFILGLVMGSFLNVVVDRVSKGQSILYPPSHCPHCRHRLAWYDLIPLISYIQLGGKCRYCKEKISLFYPLLELVTGIAFVIAYYAALSTGILYIVYLLLMTSVFIVVFFTDYKYGLIPFYVVIFGVLISLAYY